MNSISFPTILVAMVLSLTAGARAADDLVALHYKDQAPAWTAKLLWANTVSIKDFDGKDPAGKFAAAQKAIQSKGGGVVLFPAGVYEFADDLVIGTNVIVAGERPAAVTDARDEKYALTTRFEFPLYKPKFEGTGTPNETAFKRIRLANPESDSNCGLMYVHVERGCVSFGEGKDHACGGNRLVMGNIFTNAAGVADDVPRASVGQPAYHRWTARHRPAIGAQSAENLFIANNRIPKSGQANFEMPDYVLAIKKNGAIHDLAFNPGNDEFTKVVVPTGILFDYDNRPGIYANDAGIGASGDGLPNGTPETFPHGFRKGTIIRENYIYSTGRCPIAFAGDGTQVLSNVIRIPEGLWRPTCRGFEASGPGSTNDNRAIQCRGYRYTVSGNDYEVFSGTTYDKQHRTGDGEGIMHENHANSKVLDSKITCNKGNAYICIWRVEVEGLEIAGNQIDKGPGSFVNVICAIDVKGRKRTLAGQPYVPVRNLLIHDNTVRGAAIEVLGENKGGNVVENNKSLDAVPAIQVNENDCAEVKNNTNFAIYKSEAEAAAAQKAKSKTTQP